MTIQHDRVPVHDNLNLQHHLFQTCLFELEHVLAQDWYHWCLYQGLQDGPFERRGSIFLRSDGGMFRSLQKAATQRGGTLIRTDTLPLRTEEILALIGFGLGRRIDTPGYVGQIDLAARGPTQPIEPRPHVLAVHPSRQELDPPAVATDFQDLAWTTRARQGGSTTPSTDVSVGVRRTCEQGTTPSPGVKRPRTDPGPTLQKDPDIHQCLELPSVGSSRKDLETIDSRSDLLRGSFQDDRRHPYDCQPAGTHSSVHSPETDAIGSAGSLLQRSDTLETRHLPSECGQPGTVRPPDKAHGQWPDAVDRRSSTTLDLATIAIGPSSGPDSQEMRALILELSLGNDANDCFMNTALFGELWACCMDNTFSWELLGTWQPKLIQLLERGSNLQWLMDSGCLGSLLDGWFEAHTMGAQHDVAEFLGWLRLAMHSQLFEAVQQAPRWEARFEATIEDWGLTCSPIVTREEKPAGCTLQELVHMWHDQPPYCLGLVGSATTVCLQINRFPALGIRSKTLISWNRQHVMMPCYMSTSGRTVNWIEYTVVAVALHRGLEPTAGHYQCLLQTGGGRFLCDDDRVAISVPHLQAMEEDVYLVWLTRTVNLTAAFRTVVSRPNPFVPLYRA